MNHLGGTITGWRTNQLNKWFIKKYNITVGEYFFLCF